MKLNINDRTNLRDIKLLLAEKNVSATAIGTIEKALKKGLSFSRAEDLGMLNIPTLDMGVVGEVLDFGVPIEVVKNINTVEYRLAPVGEKSFFFGYQLVVNWLNADGFTVEQSFPIEGQNRVIVDFDMNILKPGSVVTLRVNTAQGKNAKIGFHIAEDVPKDEVLEVAIATLSSVTIDVAVDKLVHGGNPAINPSYPIKGKVISNRPDARMDGYQVVILAATSRLADGISPDFSPVAFAKTETNGYFVTSPLLFEKSADLTHVLAAKAVVSKDTLNVELPVRLIVTGGEADASVQTSMLPQRLILPVNDTPAVGQADQRASECGCNDLNFHEKKTLEEHSYYTVVRTSEPSIIADVLEEEKEIDLQDIYGVGRSVPLSVLKKFHSIESRQIKTNNFSVTALAASTLPATPTVIARAVGNAVLATDVKASAFNHELLDTLLAEHKVKTIIRGNAKPVFKGRTHLNPVNQIDWDDTPTIYQAASIAHGHLLHFKQEWMSDGYSIGDLVYSLPLAPGQKKQIAVLDWERRESAANSQSIDYEESLNNSLVRDRDISEVISGTLTENIRGNSKANTGGIGFGLGSSVMGIIPGVGSFGSLLGISGGTSSSGASSSQNSNRESTVNSLQSISDRTQQAASVVRSQRATVVQTVSQGERVQATAESVANYNHCHAITIQYFEVLRHFSVRNRLAGVQECLFVPLQMAPFDLDKCLRWRNALEKHLFRREFGAGFEAVARIQNEKESPFENYYDSIGFPRKNFAEQAIRRYSGELFMEFSFFNLKAAKVDDDIVSFFAHFGISLDALRDKQISDQELAMHVGPRAIEYLLDAFTIKTDKGVDLKLDLTLLSSFRQSAVLRISLRQRAETPSHIGRDQIEAINIKLDLDKLSPKAPETLTQFQDKYMKIRLRTASLRYSTDNTAGSLLDGRVDNDIFAGSDGAYITTPLTAAELRNPRGEDVNAANNLLHHLNENMEYYHKCLFFDMTPERRFMLLDGIIAPGKALGRSVASVVENRVIGIAGNSLIMPVAPGYQLDPTIDESFDLFAQYYHEEPEPMRVSMPTKGIYAESVIGKCNSCEEKDETRFWRWEESPIPDSPNTQILPLNTDTRRADPGNLQAKDFPSPVVNIQNAPNLPDSAGLQNLMQLLGKGDAFRDATGLNQTQLNALATFQKTLDTAQSFGKEAAELAKAAAIIGLAQEAQKNGSLDNPDAKETVKTQLDVLNGKVDALERAREATAKDVESIDAAKQKRQIDDGQAKDLTEDRIRKGQGTTTPTPRPAPRRGKRKYHVTLIMKDYERRPLVGTFVLNYGSLIDETFEITSSPVKKFEIELDASRDNELEIKGNPFLTGVSFPGDPDYYFHDTTIQTTVGSNLNLTFEVFQTRDKGTIEVAQGTSDSKVIEQASSKELSITSNPSGEVDLLVVKFGTSISLTGSRTKTHTESTETGSTQVTTEEHTYLRPRRALIIKQKGVALDDVNLDG